MHFIMGVRHSFVVILIIGQGIFVWPMFRSKTISFEPSLCLIMKIENYFERLVQAHWMVGRTEKVKKIFLDIVIKHWTNVNN